MFQFTFNCEINHSECKNNPLNSLFLDKCMSRWAYITIAKSFDHVKPLVCKRYLPLHHLTIFPDLLMSI